jgi:hypothetical protein
VDLFAELLRLTAAFDAEQVDYAICGAIALAVHGAPRATKDIDIMAREIELPRLREAARSCGFTIEALPMTFESSGISIRRFTKNEPSGRTLMLDVLIADSILEAVWASRVRLEVALPSGESRVLSVVSREGLITLKVAAGRPQDLVDVRRIQELARDEAD